VAVKLRRAHAIGPLAQLDLERADNAQLIEAVIPNEQYRALNLRDGDTLLVKPRRLHVFVDQGDGI
jgi:sulfate transport system ATP-binding protein